MLSTSAGGIVRIPLSGRNAAATAKGDWAGRVAVILERLAALSLTRIS
jgi:hypothetical protein